MNIKYTNYPLFHYPASWQSIQKQSLEISVNLCQIYPQRLPPSKAKCFEESRISEEFRGANTGGLSHRDWWA